MIAALLLAISSPSQSAGCLDHLEKTRGVKVTIRDRQEDRVGDGYLSCSFGLTASEVREDLKRIRSAATSTGCGSLLYVSYSPLTVRFDDTKQRRLSRDQICQNAPDIKRFLLRHMNQFEIAKLELHGWRGGFLANGDIIVNEQAILRGRSRLQLTFLGPLRNR
jgi:hypothetical protein